jgi:hypothetical protein
VPNLHTAELVVEPLHASTAGVPVPLVAVDSVTWLLAGSIGRWEYSGQAQRLGTRVPWSGLGLVAHYQARPSGMGQPKAVPGSAYLVEATALDVAVEARHCCCMSGRGNRRGYHHC